VGARRSVVTVHDLGYLYFPEAHRPLDRLYLNLATGWSVARATCVLADSTATQRDLVARYGVPADRVRVAYPGWDEARWRAADEAQVAAVKARYDIHGEYLLYLGALQPRKNLARLIEAFARLMSDGLSYSQSGLRLVLAGKPGWQSEDLRDLVRRLGLTSAVVFTGYIADEDAAALMTGAHAFVFPSLYEGFGFPVLEAMACGVPVVCSNTSSLPEVAGDAALLVSPTDVGKLTGALARVLTDEDLRQSLIARGYRQIARFSWEHCAHQVKGVLEAVGRSQPAPLGSPELR
jgi:glycosyltransferase involved in cell wall biosynthesis